MKDTAGEEDKFDIEYWDVGIDHENTLTPICPYCSRSKIEFTSSQVIDIISHELCESVCSLCDNYYWIEVKKKKKRWLFSTEKMEDL